MKEMLSIVVPVYNVEKYITKCIESILIQQYENMEIILVDDGSTDRSGKICDSFAEIDSRVKVIHQINQGLSAARNAGIDMAVGEYITFVDSDDYIHPQMYSVMMEQFKDVRTDIVVCDYQEVQEGESQSIKEVNNLMPVLMDTSVLKNGYLMYEKKTRFVVAWNKIYRRKLFEGIRYPIGKVHEDAFTTYKLMYVARDVVYIDCPLYFYLIRSTSIMGAGFSEKRLLILDALQEEMEFFYNHSEFCVLGLLYTDYRDYLIEYTKLIKENNEMKLDVLEPYMIFLKKWLVKTPIMHIGILKILKTIAFAYLGFIM